MKIKNLLVSAIAVSALLTGVAMAAGLPGLSADTYVPGTRYVGFDNVVIQNNGMVKYNGDVLSPQPSVTCNGNVCKGTLGQYEISYIESNSNGVAFTLVDNTNDQSMDYSGN